MLALSNQEDDDREFAENCFDRWLSRWPQHDIDTVSPAALHQYFCDLRLTRSAPQIDREHQLMLAFFNWATRRQLAQENPLRRLSQLGNSSSRPTLAWTLAEQQWLLETAKGNPPSRDRVKNQRLRTETSSPHLYPLVVLALQTGLWLPNLLALRWRHFDVSTGNLRIPASELRTPRPLEIRLLVHNATLGVRWVASAKRSFAARDLAPETKNLAWKVRLP